MCTSPIQLKTGETVPCGKCLDCLSQRRNEWSLRLQMHSQAYERMPFFITLTYDDVHLPKSRTGQPTLCPKHVVDFLKRLRYKFNTAALPDFSYFGCGEYGDDEHFTGRPHYHMILFGLEHLYRIYDESVYKAENVMTSIWTHGYVDVCIADFGGMHYVTKYVLKLRDDDYIKCEKPFMMASKGIGKSWLCSQECQRIRKNFDEAKFKAVRDELPEVDWTSPKTILASSKRILDLLRPFVMDFRITNESGDLVPMPRYYRKKIFGAFEDWRQNPLAYYNFIKSLHKRYSYLTRYKEYDANAPVTMEAQKQRERELTIRKRVINKIK